MDPCDTLILGIGNLLWADEGFGVRCVEALHSGWEIRPAVTLMDGGTQGLYLLPYVSAARRLIVFDAIDYGLEPGTVKLVETDDVPAFMGAKKMSLHQTGFQEVLAAAALLGQLPVEMLLIGVQPVELDDFGGSLRPRIAETIPMALAHALERLRTWGYRAYPRLSPVDPQADARALALDRYEAGRPSASAASRIGDVRFLPTTGAVLHPGGE